jgi:hypothetical protein
MGDGVANGRILLADDGRALGDALRPVLRQKPDLPEVLTAEDGAAYVTEFTRAARAGESPRLCIINTRLPKLEGRAAALAQRSVERGLGVGPVPIFFYTGDPADDEFKAFLTRCGRAVHFVRVLDLPMEEQARRLGVAIEKLLLQLGGR